MASIASLMTQAQVLQLHPARVGAVLRPTEAYAGNV